MGTFRSNLPLGTSDAAVFVEGNVPNLDEAVNSQNPTLDDRFGIKRLTLAGHGAKFENQLASQSSQFSGFMDSSSDTFQMFLDSSGYSGWDVPYAAGIVLNSHNQGFTRCEPDGSACLFFTPKSDTPLPYTTTGDWASESSLFTAQNGDTPLRQDLASPIGATLISTGTRTQEQKNNDVINPIDYISLADAISEAISSSSSVTLFEDSVIRIPTDCPTLQEAIDHITPSNSSIRAVLMIESGHIPSTGLIVENGDFSWVSIESESSEVNASGSFSIEGRNSRLPVLGCIIDLTLSTSFNSYVASSGSTGFIIPGCGMKNGTRGLHATDGSIVVADNSIFTGFRQAGCHASRSSTVQCTSADFSGNNIDNSTFGAVYASRNSFIHGQYIDASNSTGYAIRAQRMGRIACPDVNVSFAKGTAFLATLSGEIFCNSGNAIATDLEGAAIICQDGRVIIGGEFICSSSFSGVAIESRGCGVISFSSGSKISGYSGTVILATQGGSISCAGITLDSGATGIIATEGGRVNARNAKITGMRLNGVSSDRGGFIEITGGSVKGSGLNDLACQNGSQISAYQCSTSGLDGSPSPANTNMPNGLNFKDNGNRGFIWG